MTDIPYSKQFRHNIKKLHLDHAENLITDEELNQGIDDLIEQEVDLHEPVGRTLIKQQLIEVEKDVRSEVKDNLDQKQQAALAKARMEEQERRLELQRQKLEQQSEEKRLLREQQKRAEERDSYRAGIDSYTNQLEHRIRKLSIFYNWLLFFLLIFSTTTATLAGVEGISRWYVITTGWLAAITGGLLTAFKVQDRVYVSRKAVAEISLECQKYDYHIDEYKGLDQETAFIEFSRNIAPIRGQQMLQEVEFWNPGKEDKKAEKVTKVPDQKDEKSKEIEEPEKITENVNQGENLADKEH